LEEAATSLSEKENYSKLLEDDSFSKIWSGMMNAAAEHLEFKNTDEWLNNDPQTYNSVGKDFTNNLLNWYNNIGEDTYN
jgi:phosphopantothenoylcysteine synthetase/decarboxylase